MAATQAAAVPAFAVQTGQPCNGCHVGGFGPQLTVFGREFKMNGYTLRAGGFNVPISAMAIASYVHTQRDAVSPPVPFSGLNDNAAVDQFGLFFAGGLGAHLGAFVQATYDGVAKAFHWDNLDLRVTTTAKVHDVNMVVGVSINNAPTVQDAFNTLPAWVFPYTGSSLAPHPSAAPLIGNLAQNTLGFTAYAWINSAIYVEAGGYGSPSADFLVHAGINPISPGNIKGMAPYWRAAYQENFGQQNVELGLFGMATNLYPSRDQSAGTADHYDDLGVDGSYQLFAKSKDVVTLNARYTYEKQNLKASQALGLASNSDGRLQDLRADASYYWRNQIGASIGAFQTWGSRDSLLYGSTRTFRPDSSGVTLQIDGTPYGAGNSTFGPRFNLRVGMQYTSYLSFNGAGSNYDGSGANASDNNTVRIFGWIAY